MHCWSFLLVNSYVWSIFDAFLLVNSYFWCMFDHFCWLTHIFGACLMHFWWLTHIFDALFDAFLLVNSYFWCFNSKPQISKKLTATFLVRSLQRGLLRHHLAALGDPGGVPLHWRRTGRMEQQSLGWYRC